MPEVPNLNINRNFGKWVPDKQEIHNMRYWKAKKATPQPVERDDKPFNSPTGELTGSKLKSFKTTDNYINWKKAQ